MTESKPFTIQHADYLKIRKLASNIYSQLLVIECYCSVYNYNEIKHIQPILKNIIEDADIINAYFLDDPEPSVLS